MATSMRDEMHHLRGDVEMGPRLTELGPNGVAPVNGGPPRGLWAPDESESEINFMEYLNLVLAQKWIVITVLAITVAISAVWTLTRPKLYRSTMRIAINSTPQITADSPFGTNWWEMERYIRDQEQILKTELLAERVVARLGLEEHPEIGGPNAAKRLLGRLEVEQVSETDIIKLSLTGLDPEHVALWLNTYADEYIQANIDSSFERSQEVLRAIQKRLDPLREKVAESERELTEFREREDALLFAEEDKNVISEQVNTLTSEYAKAQAERIRLETKISALRNLRSSALGDEASFPEVLQDSTIRTLSQQKNQHEVDLAEKLRTYKEGHPVIKELRSKIAGIDERIREQIGTIRASLQTDFNMVRQREQSLFNNIQQLKQQSIELSKQTMEYDSLMREYDQNKMFYEEMLARSKEFDISADSQVNNVRVIDPARSAKHHYSPNVKRSLAAAALFGLVLGVGLVFGLDFLDHTLRTPEQVERHVGLEVVAALPRFSEEKARVLREAFQALRTALLLAARGEKGQVVMVTSAAPAEGKTTVAFNLGKVLATGGHRVLLIDADLRKPRLHRLIKTRNVRGLTSAVLGEGELGDVIHVLGEVPNLDLVTTGPLPPNPPELYGKETFRRILENARETYDWIVLDSPPVASVTDPVICSQLADMVLLVVEYGSTKREVVREAARLLNRARVRIVGALLNKVDVERDQYYYSYYSYYRYGYGEEESASETPSSDNDKRSRSKEERIRTSRAARAG